MFLGTPFDTLIIGPPLLLLVIIVIINVTYNLIFADKLENINKLLLLNKKENIESLKDKVRSELKQGLEKDQILNKEDKMLIYKFYLKIKNEFKDIEN